MWAKRTPVLQMSTEQERRAAIFVCLRNGRAPAAIADFTGIPRATVYRVAAAFQAAEDEEEVSASSHRKVQDRSECRKRSKDFINRLQALVDADPSRSMRVVHPWITHVADGRRYCFQQDGASAHTSNIVQNWCSDTLDMFWSKEF